MTRPFSGMPYGALAVVGVLSLAGCSTPTTVEVPDEDAGGVALLDGASGPSHDAKAPHDAAPSHDAAAPLDAAPDALVVDSAPPPLDASPILDASPDVTLGPPDSDGDGTPDPSDCAPNDATAWQLLPYSSRDADGDTYTIAQSSTVCSGAALPAGYASVANGDDCDDTNPAIFVLASMFTDADGDGVGGGAAQSMCIGATAPAGTSRVGGDCAPADPAAWQELVYAYRDADGDTYTVGLSGQLCAGASLPTGYATTPIGDDCDDTNPKIYDRVTGYADTDGDGVGAGTGSVACTDGSIPAGDVATDTDCAPSDPTKWQTLTYAFVDRDGDGATIPETGTLCAGATLPPPYYATAQGNDCNDASPALTQWEIAYPDKDGDGTGALPLEILCEGSTFPAGYSRYGDDEDDTKASVGPLPPEDILDLVLD